ncbi:hypothetical protein ES703_81477 [subsurface metagenome]
MLRVKVVAVCSGCWMRFTVGVLLGCCWEREVDRGEIVREAVLLK